MIFCDIPKIEYWLDHNSMSQQEYFKKNIPLNSNVCIIDRSEVERLWPLDEKTTYNKIVYNIHEALSNHTGKIWIRGDSFFDSAYC